MDLLVTNTFSLRAFQVVLLIKNPPASTGDIRDADLISGSGRSFGGGYSNPLQYSYLENPKDRRAWQATVYRVTKSQTQLKQPGNYSFKKASLVTQCEEYTCQAGEIDSISG